MKHLFKLSVLIMTFTNLSALFSDEENARLPRLFHLDDQDRCLARPGAVYCLGEFELQPVGDSSMYGMIKEYSNDIAAFNHSHLYRGYCVSERCPLQKSNQTLATAHVVKEHALQHSQRFEQCVQKYARRYALSASLRTLKYCTTSEELQKKMNQPPDAAQVLFVKVVYAILVMNLIGTVYDGLTDDGEKNGLIAAWSIRMSWRRLTAVYEDGDPRLNQLYPLQGMRVISLLLTIYCHSWVMQYQYAFTNPQALERQYRQFDGIVMSNGSSLIQLFVMISSFLTAYNMLIYSETHQLSWLILPVLIVKRIIRIVPVHLLLVGFAATYWPYMRSGPNSAIIEEYAASCRRKFWSHAFFLNNVMDKEDICLMPTWFLPVDMHLFVLSCALTIWLSRRRHIALRLYTALFVLSAVFCGIVAYVNGYKTTAFTAIPENVRGLFRKAPSFSGFYTSSWGFLPTCFVGLFLAHLQYDLQQRNYDWRKHVWFKRLRYTLIPVHLALTYLLGVTTRQYDLRWLTALCVAIDRPLFSCLLLAVTLSCLNSKGGLMRLVVLWRGWRVPARLSLPMMLSHWIFCVAIAARPLPYHVNTFDVWINYVATLVFGYAVSLPIALLVEIPVQRFFSQIF